MRGWRTLAAFLAALVAALAAGLLAGPARADVSCGFNLSTHVVTVNITGDGDQVVIKRSGAQIVVNGSACAGATVSSTARIQINGTFKHQHLVIDLSEGSFAPGWRGLKPGRPRAGQLPEIKLAAALYPGTPVSILGSPGDDFVRAGMAGIQLNSDDDPDLTLAGGVLTYLGGLGGNDVLFAGGGINTGAPLATGVFIEGGAGDDVVIGGAGNNLLSDGPGDDTVLGGRRPAAFVPRPGRDTYRGESGDDTLKATSSADGKKDVFEGGDGTDTADYSNRSTRVCLVAFIPQKNNNYCDGGPEDGFPSVEVLIGGNGNDTLLGYSLSTAGLRLVGGPGNDTLVGTAGPDTLVGGAGNDEEDGREGDDLYLEGATPNGGDDIGLVDSYHFADDRGRNTVDYSARTGALSVTLDALQNDGEAGEHDNVHSGIHVILGGSGNDTYVGGAFADTIFAGAGDDSLTGMGSQDLLHGGPGNDVFHAVDGLPDFIFTGSGSDAFTDIDVGLDIISAAN